MDSRRIIRPSFSDYVSTIVLVNKKGRRTQICCKDYVKLNKLVVNRFSLPLLVGVGSVFTTIDSCLHRGRQLKYTSFVTPDGQYEFLKCAFGFCNSPAVLQRVKELLEKEVISSFSAES